MASSEGNFANFSVAATKGHGMHQTKPISAGDKGDGLLDRRNKRRSVVGFPAV